MTSSAVQWRCREVPLQVANTCEQNAKPIHGAGLLPITAAYASLVRLQDTLFGEERAAFKRTCSAVASPLKMFHSSGVYQKAVCCLLRDSMFPLCHALKATNSAMRIRQAQLELENRELRKLVQSRRELAERCPGSREGENEPEKDWGPLCDPHKSKRRNALEKLAKGLETWKVRDMANDADADLRLFYHLSDRIWKVTCVPIFTDYHDAVPLVAARVTSTNLMEPLFSVTLTLIGNRSFQLQFLSASAYEFWRDLVIPELFPLACEN